MLTDVLDDVRECELLDESVVLDVLVLVEVDDECELVLDELVVLDEVDDRLLLVDSSSGSMLNSAHSSTSISHWSV